MEHLLSVVANNPGAAAAGLVGMVCLAAWPLFRARTTMLGTYIGNNVGFVVHYGLLGQWTAVAMNGIMIIQSIVAIGLVRWPRLRWVYFALMPILGAASIATWQGLPSFLSAAATACSTVGRMQKNDVVLRLLLLASTPFWTAHDLAIGSLPGLIADVLSMTTGTIMLLRSPELRPAIVKAMNELKRRIAGLAPIGKSIGSQKQLVNRRAAAGGAGK